MNWKTFFIGVGAGLAGFYTVKEIASQKETVPAEKVLKQAKAAFKNSGPISGSWINMNTEAYSKPPIEYQAYKGGISRVIDGTTVQYEFIADAATGAIIETYRIN